MGRIVCVGIEHYTKSRLEVASFCVGISLGFLFVAQTGTMGLRHSEKGQYGLGRNLARMLNRPSLCACLWHTLKETENCQMNVEPHQPNDLEQLRDKCGGNPKPNNEITIAPSYWR